MDEVMEIAVGAMHLMAKDVSSRLKMKQLNCIPMFVQVLIFILLYLHVFSGFVLFCSCFTHL